MPDDVIAETKKRLKDAEDEINAENEAYEQGKAHFREKLTQYADMSKADFEKMMEGLTMDVESRRGGMGLISQKQSCQ